MSGVWGAPEWVAPAAALLGAAVVALAFSYWRSGGAGGRVRALAAVLKGVGLAALALCLADPLLSGVRPRRGANIFAVVVDNSQSLQIHDPGARQSRGQRLQAMLLADSPWQTRLGQDFDVRRLAFSNQLEAVDEFSALTFEGAGTSLGGALESLARRFRGLPIAGVLLLTDGNATDSLPADLPWDELPPIYPTPVGSDRPLADVSVQRVSASETNFESAPVTIRADVCASGIGAEPLVVALRDEAGAVVEKQTVRPDADSGAATVRFQIRPDAAGMNFYTVAAALESESAAEGSATAGAPPGGDNSGRPSPQPAPPPAGKPTAAPRGRPTQEATLANNTRLVSVDRGGGPYRILYISGRPNWEFKFLRRALADDDQLELVGLVRIAKREPKFSFRARGDRSTNQLFKGFENPEGDAAESYDEPVLVRLGTADEEELRDGFPRTAEELYKYDALVLDDLEAQFFSPDQLTLIEDFVSRRGGGLLMLGGAESFVAGDYRRTPVADVLPVYVEASELDQRGATAEDPRYRLALTRDGWLEPWVRLRKTEPEDRQRLAAMPPFQTLNEAGRLKPGATVLAQVLDDAGAAHPALVAQRYGRGRSAALLIADLWRWGLRRTGQADDDLDKSWRQTARWLVADVPQQVEVELAPEDQASAGGMTLQIRVRDAEYLPLDNAEVKVQIATPDGRTIAVDAEPSADEAGVYVASHLPRAAGAYRAEVAATAPDGTAVGSRSTGWAAQPLADEFRRLAPDRRRLEEIASRTGGEVVELDQLDRFVGTLDSRGAPITEPWTRPLWHHPLFFIVTIGCLAGEWGLRRWKGLA